MRVPICPLESAAVREAMAGEATAGVRAHLRYCPGCQVAFESGRALRLIGAAPAGLPGLPSPTALWWRSRILRRRAARAREVRAIVVFDLGAKLLGVGAGCAGFLWAWALLARRLEDLAPVMADGASAGPGTALLFGAGGLFGVALLSSALVLGRLLPRNKEAEI